MKVGIDLSALLALQKDRGLGALKEISDRLRVKEMGPADHIRTKHEVKAFLANGDLAAAKEILVCSRERLAFWARESQRREMLRLRN